MVPVPVSVPRKKAPERGPEQALERRDQAGRCQGPYEEASREVVPELRPREPVLPQRQVEQRKGHKLGEREQQSLWGSRVW